MILAITLWLLSMVPYLLLFYAYGERETPASHESAWQPLAE